VAGVTRISVVDGLGPHSHRLCGATTPRRFGKDDAIECRDGEWVWSYEADRRQDVDHYDRERARELALEHLSFEELLAMAFEKFVPADQPWNERA
jgi:hypothetical protein